MKKLLFLFAALPLVGFCLGCGPKATDTTDAVPPPTTADTQAELEAAMKKGQINEQGYGKETGQNP